MSDATAVCGADELDALAEAVFGGDEGLARLHPLLRRWDDEVGPLREDDDQYPLWQAMRADWVLCDAAIVGGDGPGDTWARRAAIGAVPGVEPDPRWHAIATTFVGLFEVWPSRPAFLRDRVRGVSLPLGDDIELDPPTEKGPVALWEARITVVEGAAHLCRRPMPYPLSILPMLELAHALRFASPPTMLSWSKLRRSWLTFHRAPRAAAEAVFAQITGIG